MSNSQQSKHPLLKFRKLKNRLSQWIRPSRATSQGAGVHETGPQRMEAISATALNATLPSVNANLPRESGDISGDQPRIVASPTPDEIK
ncbi:hypothetical protein C0993_004963, partial [Termitomyces sp. T159_Od127]